MAKLTGVTQHEIIRLDLVVEETRSESTTPSAPVTSLVPTSLISIRLFNSSIQKILLNIYD